MHNSLSKIIVGLDLALLFKVFLLFETERQWGK
jgi:hypothetical protein